MNTDLLTMILIVSILLVGLGLTAFFWAFKGGQFDDEERSKRALMFDGEDALLEAQEREQKQQAEEEKTNK